MYAVLENAHASRQNFEVGKRKAEEEENSFNSKHTLKKI